MSRISVPAIPLVELKPTFEWTVARTIKCIVSIHCPVCRCIIDSQNIFTYQGSLFNFYSVKNLMEKLVTWVDLTNYRNKMVNSGKAFAMFCISNKTGLNYFNWIRKRDCLLASQNLPLEIIVGHTVHFFRFFSNCLNSMFWRNISSM